MSRASLPPLTTTGQDHEAAALASRLAARAAVLAFVAQSGSADAFELLEAYGELEESFMELQSRLDSLDPPELVDQHGYALLLS